MGGIQNRMPEKSIAKLLPKNCFSKKGFKNVSERF
jgi:hypothetical protein